MGLSLIFSDPYMDFVAVLAVILVIAFFQPPGKPPEDYFKT